VPELLPRHLQENFANVKIIVIVNGINPDAFWGECRVLFPAWPVPVLSVGDLNSDQQSERAPSKQEYFHSCENRVFSSE
jgi:hypothetical protein